MRVLIAPDGCADLPSVDVARLVGDGWSERNPQVEVRALPLSAGDKGFVSALAGSAGGRLEPTTAHDAWASTVPCTLLVVQTGSERTLYAEAAQVAGMPAAGTRELPGPIGTYGVGELIGQAVDLGATSIVVGIGGLATLDAGLGALAALAGRAAGDAADVPTDVPAARARLAGVSLTVATSTDATLLGMQGACAGAVDDLGLTREHAQERERGMGKLVDLSRRVLPERIDLLSGATRRTDRQPGAGAGGGLGYGLALLGARLVPGPAYVAETVGLADAVAGADLVVTVTRVFDWRVLEHSVLKAVSDAVLAVGRPLVVLSEQVEVGRRDTMSLGVSGSYALAAPGRPRRRAGDDEALGERLWRLARRVAGTWTPTDPDDVP